MEDVLYYPLVVLKDNLIAPVHILTHCVKRASLSINLSNVEHSYLVESSLVTEWMVAYPAE